MKFSSKKSAIFLIVICFISVIAITSIIGKIYIASILLILVLAYFVWMWFGTYYLVEGDTLFYKSALTSGTIQITSISEIVKNRYLLSGIKAALSTKGLIIKYNKWDDVYISPKDTDRFIIALKTINPNINVRG